MGGGDPPYEVVRLRVCEKMGWSFTEYDEQSADDVFTALEIWRIDGMKTA